MTHSFQAGRLIEGPRRDVDFVISPGVPEEISTTLLAESSIHIGGLILNGAIPLQASFFHEYQIPSTRRSMRRDVTMDASALGAVAVYDVVQCTVNFVPHPTAQAPTRGSERVCPVGIHRGTPFE